MGWIWRKRLANIAGPRRSFCEASGISRRREFCSRELPPDAIPKQRGYNGRSRGDYPRNRWMRVAGVWFFVKATMCLQPEQVLYVSMLFDA
jgi:hypothetical protein